jgi:hypothetical protein
MAMSDLESLPALSVDSQRLELAKECARRHRSCLYTAGALYNWLRTVRYLKVGFIVLPIVLAGVATWKIYSDDTKVWSIILTGAAGLIPAIYGALKMDDHIGHVRKIAAEFTNLRDRFRHAALVTSKKDFAAFEAECANLIDRMDRAREEGITAPAWAFKQLKRQIARKDYLDIVTDEQVEASFRPPSGRAAV